MGFGRPGFGAPPQPGGLLQAKPEFVFRPFFHDDGPKRFLGRTGNFNGEEIIEIIFEQPVTAKFICRKLYAFFVSDEPAPDEVVEALAETFRKSQYELKPVLEQLFRSELFYRDAVIGSQIKSPVQLVAQAIRQLKADVQPPLLLNPVLRQMGQVLLDPPNVKGWDGGRAWITTTTLMARYNFANFLVNGAPMGSGPPRGFGGFGGMFGRGGRMATRVDVRSLVPPERAQDPKAVVEGLARRLLSAPLSAAQREDLIAYMKKPAGDTETQIKGLIHLLMSTPNYQLC
jgi:hypothetical protein